MCTVRERRVSELKPSRGWKRTLADGGGLGLDEDLVFNLRDLVVVCVDDLYGLVDDLT